MKKTLSLFLALSLLLICMPTAMASSLEVRADMALSYGGGTYIDQNEALTAYCQNTGLDNFSYGYIVTYTGGFGGGGADASLPVENASGFTKLSFDARIIADDFCTPANLFDVMYPEDAPNDTDLVYAASSTADVSVQPSWEDEFLDIQYPSVNLTESWQHFEIDLTPYNFSRFRMYINPLGAVSGQNEICSAIVANVKLEGAGNVETPVADNTKPSAWAEEYVSKALELEIIDETGNKYQDNITRREFAYIITDSVFACLTAMNITPPEFSLNPVFEDVEADDYLYIAYQMGIIKGISDNMFAPLEFITRQDIAVMMHRAISYVDKLAKTEHLPHAGDLTNYTDISSISTYAMLPVGILSSAGIMKGTSDTTISPLDNTTVEQAIILAVRAVELFI